MFRNTHTWQLFVERIPSILFFAFKHFSNLPCWTSSWMWRIWMCLVCRLFVQLYYHSNIDKAGNVVLYLQLIAYKVFETRETMKVNLLSAPWMVFKFKFFKYSTQFIEFAWNFSKKKKIHISNIVVPCNTLSLVNIEIPKIQCVHKWMSQNPRPETDWLLEKNEKKGVFQMVMCRQAEMLYWQLYAILANETHCFRWHFHLKGSHCRKFSEYNFVVFSLRKKIAYINV